jgi:hypothetical protein
VTGKYEQKIYRVAKTMRDDGDDQIATACQIQQPEQQPCDCIFNDARDVLIGMGKPERHIYSDKCYAPASGAAAKEVGGTIQDVAAPDKLFSQAANPG